MHSFNAVCDAQTHTLILGSMPGVTSLNAVEYYAHKRNAFWPIMISLMTNQELKLELTNELSYDARLAMLSRNGIGLWDVLAQCEREGSLDAAIVKQSVVCNDFVGLLTQFPTIKNLAFNGKAAQNLFQKHVAPQLTQHEQHSNALTFISLPSSSPAMASLSLEAKCDQWRSQLSQALSNTT